MIDPWFALVLLIIVILAAFALLTIILVAFIAGFYMAERYYRGVAKSYEQLRDKYENLSQENTKLKDEVRELKARLNEAICEISRLSADLAAIHGNQDIVDITDKKNVLLTCMTKASFVVLRYKS